MDVRALLRLVRWPGAVTAGVNAMTGFLVAHAHVRSTREEAVAAFAAAGAGAIVYCGGVVLNDVADAARDAEIHPDRPIPSGRVARRDAALFGGALLAIGAGVSLVAAGPFAGAATAAAALFACLYDFAAKRWRVPGALALALARAANALAGALAGAAAFDLLREPLVPIYAAAVLAYTAILTLASTHEDRTPSRPTAGAFAIALFVCAALSWSRFFAAWRMAPALALAPLLGTLLVAARDASEPEGPGMGVLVRAGVFGFLLADSTWLFGIGRYDDGFLLLLGYVALRFVLSRSRS